MCYFTCTGCNLLWFVGEDWGLVIGTVKVNEADRKVWLNYRDEQRMKQQMMTSELLSVGFTHSHTHTQMHKNCSHYCSSSFLSPFGFLSACCLATRTPTIWLGCDSPGDATSWVCSTHVTRIRTHACSGWHPSHIHLHLGAAAAHWMPTRRCFCLCLTRNLQAVLILACFHCMTRYF